MKSFRRSLRVLGLLLCASLVTAVCEAQTPPTRIMPLGDSLTSGSSVEGAYRNRLYDLLTSAGYNVDFVGTQMDASNPTLPDRDHQGLGGYRIHQIQSGLPAWLDMIEDPDVVLLMIGTNDFSSQYNVASAPSRLADLITEIATSRPFAKIIVSNLPVRTDDPNLEVQQSSFNASIPQIVNDQVALGRQVTLVDMHSALVAGDLVEGVHPSATGFGKMADVWFPAISSVISPLGTSNPPAIVRTEEAEDLQHLTVNFSKPISDASASLANFSMDGGLSISQATLDPVSKRSITLTTSAQTPGKLYTLTVNGVRDRTPQQNPIAAGSTVGFSSYSLVNGSFENGETGWAMTGNRIVYDTTPPYVASHGGKMLVLNGGQTPPNGLATQAFTTIPGQYYILDFDLGILALNFAEQRLGVEVTGTVPLISLTESVFGNGQGDSIWTPRSHGFVANSSTTALTFRDLSATTQNLDLLLDHVRITAAPAPVNTAPVAIADNYMANQNSTLVVPATGVLSNDTDAESNPLTAAINAGTMHGSLTLNPNGSFGYTPDPGYTGPDSFTYHANDGLLDSNIATVSITVAAGIPGSLVNGSFENGETGWNMTGNRLVYASDGTYIASDGTKMAIFNAGNTNPDAVVSQSFTTTPGQFYSIDFDIGFLSLNTMEQRLGVEISGTGTLLSEVDSVFGNGLGNSVWSPRTHTFVANSSTTVLTFRDLSATTTGIDLMLDHVRITAGAPPANTAPVAVADSWQAYQNSALVIPAAGVLSNDSDAQADPLTAVLNVAPVHGSVILDPNGGFTYTPSSGYTGADSFTYHANDGQLDSDIATVSITVNPVTPGTLVNGSFELGETGWSMTGNRVVYASDGTYIAPDGSRMLIFNAGNTTPDAVVSQSFVTTPGSTYTLDFEIGILALNTASQVLGIEVTGSGALLSVGETVTGNGLGNSVWSPRSLTFVANNSSTTLTFRDLSATTSGIDLMLDHVRVTSAAPPANTAPVAVADSYSTNQGSALVIAAPGVLSNDTDAQSDPLTAILNAGPGHGSLTLNSNGSFTYTPTGNYTGPDSFTYHANDGLLDSNIVTVGITVISANTAPVAVANSYSTNQGTALVIAAPGVLSNDTDAQSDPLTAILNAGPGHGSLTLNPNGSFTYTPTGSYTGPDSFTYHANDGLLDSNIVTVSITVNPVVAPDVQVLVNGSFESGYTGWTSSGNQAIEFYQTTDGLREVDFNGRDQSPNAVLSQSFATVSGKTYTLAFDSGVLSYVKKNQKISVTVADSGTLLSRNITLAGAGAGGIQWTSNSYTFVAGGSSATLTFKDISSTTIGIDLLLDNVRVTGPPVVPNTAPVAVSDSYAINRDTPLSVVAPGVLSNDTSPSPGVPTALLDSPPVNGTLYFNPDGSFYYVPFGGYTGTDAFTYHLRSGNVDSNVATVSITVLGVSPGILVNPSFESGFDGWTASGHQAIAYYPTTDGIRLIAFNGSDLAPDAVLSQSFATIPGETYSLDFDAGIFSYTNDPLTLGVSVDGSGPLLNRTVTLAGSGNGSIRWQAQRFTFVADGATATLIFRDLSEFTVGLDLLLDNVRVNPLAAPPVILPPSSGPDPILSITPTLARTTGDTCVISMIAPGDGSYVLERSPDLRTWSVIDTMADCHTMELIEFHDAPPQASSGIPCERMFYRIGRKPAN